MPIIRGGVENAETTAVGGNVVAGYDFTATANASLTALGFWDSGSDGLGSRFEVGLWDKDSALLLASAFIDDGDALDSSLTIEGGQYRYETLASAVTLTSGTTYTLAFHTVVFINVLDTLLIETASLVENPLTSISASLRGDSGPSLTFPELTFAAPNIVGNANALVSAATVPLPTTLSLAWAS
jgi:hypothetical protein